MFSLIKSIQEILHATKKKHWKEIKKNWNRLLFNETAIRFSIQCRPNF